MWRSLYKKRFLDIAEGPDRVTDGLSPESGRGAESGDFGR